MSELSPKTNSELFGHEEAERQLLREAAGGKLAHGWIIGGPRGIGKSTLAYRFARMMLAGANTMEMPHDHPVFRRVAAGSHPDLLVVEPLFDAKKGEVKNEISVEQARQIAQFLSLTPGESQWRVVIVDTIDAFNANGANAILKILEEPPPQALLLLISNNPSRLLPTIRSRCRMLKLRAPAGRDFDYTLRHIRPDIEVADLPALREISEGCPGAAVTYAQQGAPDLYKDILALMASAPHYDTLRLHGFAETLTGGQMHARFALFAQLSLLMLERLSKLSAGGSYAPIFPEEKSLLSGMLTLHPPEVWPVKWQQACEQFSLSQRLHLDYKQVVIAFFHSISSREGFLLGTAA